MKTDEKITLWSERIHEFQFSGQTCKTWCQEHHVPVSSMNYWMRKLKTLDEQSDTDMIFAKILTEKEILKNETLNISPSPVRIFITNAIRIEVMPECPPELFHVLIQGLKDHAWSGRWHNRLPCLWSYRFKKKLSRTCCNYQAEIQTRSLFALHVCVLQPQADFY